MKLVRFRYPDDEIGWLWPTGGGGRGPKNGLWPTGRKKPTIGGPKEPWT